MSTSGWIFVGVVAVSVIWVIAIYNGLVSLRNRVKNGFAQIDVQLQRRYDLIPNLVETAKAYMAHERGTLEAVIAARNTAQAAAHKAGQSPTDGGAIRELAGAEMALGGALGRFFALAEAYPDLKANTNFLQLQRELADIENKVAAARRFFNNAVAEFNTAQEQFPAAIFASQFGFAPRDFFEVAATERAALEKPPSVSFS
jgi:LemA protein